MKYTIPAENNLYGTILDIESKKHLVDILKDQGWYIRKSTWTDFEARNEWAEITIEGEDKRPLINGVIDPVMFNHFVQLLNLIDIKYSLELHDNEGKIVIELRR